MVHVFTMIPTEHILSGGVDIRIAVDSLPAQRGKEFHLTAGELQVQGIGYPGDGAPRYCPQGKNTVTERVGNESDFGIGMHHERFLKVYNTEAECSPTSRSGRSAPSHTPTPQSTSVSLPAAQYLRVQSSFRNGTRTSTSA